MPGAKHGLVLKRCAPDLLTQRRNLLLEVYGKYRPNHEAKLKEARDGSHGRFFVVGQSGSLKEEVGALILACRFALPSN